MWIVYSTINHTDGTSFEQQVAGPWDLEQVNQYIKLCCNGLDAVSSIEFILVPKAEEATHAL